MNYIESQFGNPRGLIGHLVGFIMAYENRARNQWALSLLNVQPTDHILEIGYGPGWAIQQASRLASNGLVAGVDISKTMLQQAKLRNRQGINSGKVVLRYGSSVQIPFDDNSFDKVYAVNSFHEWNDPIRGLQDVKRVLKPAGLITIVEHPHGGATEDNINKVGEGLSVKLAEQGFKLIRVVFNSVNGNLAVGVKGVKA
jgi:ubiquinone/menaquinone biosynthesis C-methylase UbiE